MSGTDTEGSSQEGRKSTKVSKRRAAFYLSPVDQALVDSGEIADPLEAVATPDGFRLEREGSSRSDSNDQRLIEDVPPHW